MLLEFQCPMCSADAWEEYAVRVYRRSDVRNGGSCPDEYTRRRLDVLFSAWFPDRDEVCVSVRGCGGCGFVCFNPRPDARDVERKYELLGKIGNTGAGETPVDSPYELRRARRMYGILRSNSSLKVGTRVLDYGGGDGRLMRDVAGHGARCFLVDYNQKPCSWVTRLGNTLADITKEERRYDLCVLSHVMEHVVTPVDLLKGLRFVLKREGQVYCEVPMECWRRLPRLDEPVTHVNFFTPSSLATAFRRAGYAVNHCRLCEYWAGAPDRLGLAIGCWARVSDPSAVAGNSRSDLMRWMTPNLLRRVQVAICSPRTTTRNLQHRIRAWN